MLFALLYLLVRRALRLAAGSASDVYNDIELIVLRHQLAVLKRQVGRPRVRRGDRLFMAALSRVLPRPRWSSFVVSPQTLLRWHRELVRRKWTYRRNATGGRLPLAADVRELIVRMGRENPRWGCVRIRGELAKLGIRVSATAIRTLRSAPWHGRTPAAPVDQRALVLDPPAGCWPNPAPVPSDPERGRVASVAPRNWTPPARHHRRTGRRDRRAVEAAPSWGAHSAPRRSPAASDGGS